MNGSCPAGQNGRSALLKTFAIIYGVIFLAVGIAGFIPTLMPNGLLLGYFNVDPLHNSIHLVFGIVALWVSVCPKASQIYFRIVGIIYVILALLGFWYGEEPVAGIVSNNPAVAWLHLGVGILALILGFCTHKKCHTH